MKKLCFFILTCIFAGKTVFAGESRPPHIECKFSGDFQDEKSGANSGIIFKSPHLSAQFFTKLTQEDNTIIFDNYRWGTKLSLFSPSSPLTFYYGRNVFSSAVSKLKNPAPSTVSSPLTRNFGLSVSASVSSPGMSSSVQPISCATTFSINQKETVFSAEGSVIEDKSFFISSSLKKTFSAHISDTISMIAGRYQIEGKTSALTKQNGTFPLQWQYSALFQNYFKSPLLKFRFQTGFAQSPYTFADCPQWNMWFKISPVLSFGPFLINCSYFAIPFCSRQPAGSPLITAASICRTVEQFEFNPQTSLLLNDGESALNFGAYFTDTFKVTATKHPETLEVFKARFAGEIETRTFKSRLDFTAANILLSGTPPDKASTPQKYYGITLDSDYFSSSFRSDFSIGYKYYPPLKTGSVPEENLTLSLSANLASFKALTAAGGTDITKKGGKTKKSQYLSLTYRLSQKYLSLYFKCRFITS